MRAVVVYESMYGNTHMIADAIGAGLKAAFDVSVVPVPQASPAVPAGLTLGGVDRRQDRLHPVARPSAPLTVSAPARFFAIWRGRK